MDYTSDMSGGAIVGGSVLPVVVLLSSKLPDPYRPSPPDLTGTRPSRPDQDSTRRNRPDLSDTRRGRPDAAS